MTGLRSIPVVDTVVVAETEAQVATAVRFAADRGLPVTVTDGVRPPVRGRREQLIIDVSRLTGLSVDPQRQTAFAGPAVRVGDLARALRAHGLMFPLARSHRDEVAECLLAADLDSRTWGRARDSIIGADVVTHDGERVHARPGAHPGFDRFLAGHPGEPIGIVTRLHLQARPVPPGIMTSSRHYAIDALDELVLWLEAVQPLFPRGLEAALVIGRGLGGVAARSVVLEADALCSTMTGAHDALGILDSAPAPRQVVSESPRTPCTVDALVRRFGRLGGGADGELDLGPRFSGTRGDLLPSAVRAELQRSASGRSRLRLRWWGPTDRDPAVSSRLLAHLWPAPERTP